MASATRYKIGRFAFLEMDRPPLFSSVKVNYVVSANTDGASIFKDGNRGELFQINTLVDAQGERDVLQVIRDYHNATGIILEVRHDWNIYGDYLIDHVLPTQTEILKIVSGIRRANPTHLVECVWTMYPIRARRRVVETNRETDN